MLLYKATISVIKYTCSEILENTLFYFGSGTANTCNLQLHFTKEPARRSSRLAGFVFVSLIRCPGSSPKKTNNGTKNNSFPSLLPPVQRTCCPGHFYYTTNHGNPDQFYLRGEQLPPPRANTQTKNTHFAPLILKREKYFSRPSACNRGHPATFIVLTTSQNAPAGHLASRECFSVTIE